MSKFVQSKSRPYLYYYILRYTRPTLFPSQLVFQRQLSLLTLETILVNFSSLDF